tara:strand:+ start:287 stop:403 length:117 start_codon:yes stop_codon:yes gene_type:complete
MEKTAVFKIFHLIHGWMIAEYKEEKRMGHFVPSIWQSI